MFATFPSCASFLLSLIPYYFCLSYTIFNPPSFFLFFSLYFRQSFVILSSVPIFELL